MTQDELVDLLQADEWRDVEFKESVPVGQSLFRPAGTGRYALAKHLQAGAFSAGPGVSVTQVGSAPPGIMGLVSDQPLVPKGGLVTATVTNLTDHQKLIIRLCNLPRTRADLMEQTGNPRPFFRRKHLDPLVRAGLAYLRERTK